MESISRSSVWFKLAYFPILQMGKTKSPIAKLGLEVTGGKKSLPEMSVSLCDVFWLVVSSPLRILFAVGMSVIFATFIIIGGLAACAIIYLLVVILYELPTWAMINSPSIASGLSDIGKMLLGCAGVIIGLSLVGVAADGIINGIKFLRARVKAYKEKVCPILEITD